MSIQGKINSFIAQINKEVEELLSYSLKIKWIAPEKPVLGQIAGLNIPIENERLISFDTQFPPGYKEKCSPIWKEFLKNIVIE